MTRYEIVERIENALRAARIYHPEKTPAWLIYEWLEEGPDSDTWDYLEKRTLHIPHGLVSDALRTMRQKYPFATEAEDAHAMPVVPELPVEDVPENVLALVTAVLSRAAQLATECDQAHDQVALLSTTDRCNGWTHVNAAGSLYIHHKNGSPCPLHGDDIKDRGRVYVGRNIEKCQTAINALANYNAWHIAKQTLSDYQRDLGRIEADLGRVGGKQLPLFEEKHNDRTI